MSKNTHAMGVKLEREVYAFLKRKAKETGRSIGWLLNNSVRIAHNLKGGIVEQTSQVPVPPERVIPDSDGGL